MKQLLHKIAHFLGWNYGVPYSFYKEEKLMMSWKCFGCGKLEYIHCVDKIIDRELTKKD